MWPTGKTVKCPVCRAILGKTVMNSKSSFVCSECQWIFSFDEDGKVLTPIKVEKEKKATKCDCEGCKVREDYKKPS